MSNDDTPKGLIDDLSRVGMTVDSVWDLVNTKTSYKRAIPVLLEWLEKVDDIESDSVDRKLRNLEEGIIRALTTPQARPMAAPKLIQIFSRRAAGDELLGWIVGNALSVVADHDFIDELTRLATDAHYGRARQMIPYGLARVAGVKAVPVLVSLLSDQDLVIQATQALGKLRASAAYDAISRLQKNADPIVRREARKALNKLSS